MNLGFLASHGGSNMQAVVDACKCGVLQANPAVLISNNRKAKVLERARREGIEHHVFNGITHPDRKALDQVMVETLERHGVELLLLLGYMKKIGEKTLEKFQGKILNIHPALLPRFGGKGMYGMHVHEAVLAAGERETGVTIHLVDGKYDTGPIVAQTRLPVEEGDTPEELAKRVLEVEHRFLVETLGKIISQEICLEEFSTKLREC